MKSNFVRVRCSQCKNEQNVFDCAASEVKCLVCGAVLVRPKGGKAKFESAALEVLG